MRADEALKVSKRSSNSNIIKLDGETAYMNTQYLRWTKNSVKVDFAAHMSDQWEPVECDCEVCEAKRYLKSSNYYDGTTGLSSIRTLIKHAKCLKEG